MQKNRDYSKISLYFPDTEDSTEAFKCIEAFKHKTTQFITLLINDYMKKCNIKSYEELTDQKIKLMLTNLLLHNSPVDNNVSNELLTNLLLQLNRTAPKEDVREPTKVSIPVPLENDTETDVEDDTDVTIEDEEDYSSINKQDTLDSLSMFF